ncbi:MAG: hypothetical protein ACFFCS_25105 [Candidatus Hodarchaeota archaeon]
MEQRKSRIGGNGLVARTCRWTPGRYLLLTSFSFPSNSKLKGTCSLNHGAFD